MGDGSGYDQHVDLYTDKNASYWIPSLYQPGQQQTGYTPQHPAYPPEQPGNVQQPYNNTKTTLVVNQPQTGKVIIQPRPPNRMVDSILACLCCFLPTGIFAIYYAKQANRLVSAGDYEGARWMSDNARKFIIISVFLGFILVIFCTFYARQHYSMYN
ncbi:proline-rich transmembrane protein 1-like [Mercenaria mercenaria]|uniref:proline-rich transmembrane protein 1-like n=1 Tax=Mercenaria mercenaria TaxID=6596 RepID=UPI00234EA91D|nr:proline-rich transmembrane protein 1-like [Mercenaria mercenaria]